ncbi:dTDP-4-dehydrorhamnose 3,5-epimerase [Methyloceanibacter sp. wino2]|uniref:dTDP-4-dehydrorhamnose 3,5-epimerase n=1 Tax=Methyloceanibacter sp. wino2 TaxID=2170729 RepID=UPI000D3EBEAA|nr:dTDP-4-dehydrorhamnose 3,5-epimerase [Methyloceanibacter sp. wino2]
MLVRQLGLPEVLEIVPKKHGDARGFFSETYNAKRFAEAGIELPWVQDNHAFSAHVGVLRGLHFQKPPFAQDKLVRVAKGAIVDVAVDVRRGSPRFGQWCSLRVSADDWNQILIPKGFAHGYMTLEPDTEVIYKVSELYAPEHDCGIHFADPDIGIVWPLDSMTPTLSAKDEVAPRLRDVETGFEYSEN